MFESRIVEEALKLEAALQAAQRAVWLARIALLKIRALELERFCSEASQASAIETLAQVEAEIARQRVPVVTPSIDREAEHSRISVN